MDTPHLAIIIPTHSDWLYAASAVHSAFACTVTPDDTLPEVFLVDDASPELLEESALSELLGPWSVDAYVAHLHLHTFKEWGGYIRSVNRGLQLARRAKARYTCVANADLLFTPGWNRPLEAAVAEKNYALVGPLTNAPGPDQHQCVTNFFVDYKLTDDAAYLNFVASNLRCRYRRCVTSTPAINGFCMFGRTDMFWQNAFELAVLDEPMQGSVFRPSNPVNSKGQRVRSPLNELSEYEFAARLRIAGLTIGYCLDSFVFHYKAVARPGHEKGLWLRKAK